MPFPDHQKIASTQLEKSTSGKYTNEPKSMTMLARRHGNDKINCPFGVGTQPMAMLWLPSPQCGRGSNGLTPHVPGPLSTCSPINGARGMKNAHTRKGWCEDESALRPRPRSSKA